MATTQHLIVLLHCLLAAKFVASHAFKACSVSSGEQTLDCSRFCRNNCPNGYCDYLARTCKCNSDYVLKDGVCERNCADGCSEHAVCIDDSVCVCHSGYGQDDITGACVPRCSRGCGLNAKCIKPELCECLPGFQELEIDLAKVCEPICLGGCQANGFCVAPNICSCLEGFAMANRSCVPICTFGCAANETCVAPNVCACSKGFHRVPEGKCVHETCFEELNLVFSHGLVACKYSILIMVCLFGLPAAVTLLLLQIILCAYCKKRWQEDYGEEYVLHGAK